MTGIGLTIFGQTVEIPALLSIGVVLILAGVSLIITQRIAHRNRVQRSED